jgi:putative phosphoribosyl transferase
MAPRRLFHDREQAGDELAKRLLSYRDQSPVILGLPRGGVPVAHEVAQVLGAPLDVWVARKLGAPSQTELGMGAVAEGGEVFLDPHIVREIGASEHEVQAIIRKETGEVEERCRRFRGRRPAPAIEGKTVIVVDDGIATGGTARAVLRSLRRRRPGKLVFAVPVGSEDTLEDMRGEADEIVCLSPQAEFFAVGLWYEVFGEVEDDDVVALLEKAQTHAAP